LFLVQAIVESAWIQRIPVFFVTFTTLCHFVQSSLFNPFTDNGLPYKNTPTRLCRDLGCLALPDDVD
jgi:hypothetical protein